ATNPLWRPAGAGRRGLPPARSGPTPAKSFGRAQRGEIFWRPGVPGAADLDRLGEGCFGTLRLTACSGDHTGIVQPGSKGLVVLTCLPLRPIHGDGSARQFPSITQAR